MPTLNSSAQPCAALYIEQILKSSGFIILLSLISAADFFAWLFLFIFSSCTWAPHQPVQVQGLPCSPDTSWTDLPLRWEQGLGQEGFFAATAKSHKEAPPCSCSGTGTAELCQYACSDLANLEFWSTTLQWKQLLLWHSSDISLSTIFFLL